MLAASLMPGTLPATVGPWHITSQWAAWVLEQYNVHNRPLRPITVTRYAQDILAGNWQLTHQGIAFSANPIFLIDGQHRLHAIVQSDTGIQCYVFTGQSPQSQLVVDDGAIRTTANSLHLTGISVQSAALAILNVMLIAPAIPGGELAKLSKPMASSLYARHKSAIQFSLNLCKTKARIISSAAALAVLARAWYHVETHKIAEFAEVFFSGMPADRCPAEKTALACRSSLQNITGIAGIYTRIQIYRRVQRMLHEYLRGNVCTRCLSTDADLFPLPTH